MYNRRRSSPTSPPMQLLLISASLLILTAQTASSAGLGINYGQLANNLPHPDSVPPLLKSIGATRVKLYDADSKVLKAFANTGVQFIVGLGNEYLTSMCDPTQALQWVKSNVQCYLPATKITSINVGNEVLTTNNSAISSNLVPAMQNIHAALVSLNLHSQVSVTSAHNLGVLQVSYPPSAGVFRRDLTQTLTSVLDFHCKTGSPFLINPYPYFTYKTTTDPNQLLDFALFEGNGIVDPVSGLHYDSMFHAQIDATYYAMEKLGYKCVCLQVSETGWPSKGDADEIWATPENARKYNSNMLKLIAQKKGTPKKPNSDLNVYVFALFNENEKSGPKSERNFGLFKPDGTPVYDLGFNVTGGLQSAPKTSSGTPPTGFTQPSGFTPPPDGYLSITTDDAVRNSCNCGRALTFMSLIVVSVLLMAW